MGTRQPPGPSVVIRASFGTATVACLLVAVFARGDPRWFVAAGACGTIWWVWDILWEHVLVPSGDWLLRLLTGQEPIGEKDQLRPTLDDTIRLLENHLQQRASRQVCINAAVRLEEIYRMVKKDPARASRVIEQARELYPDAVELERYDCLGED